MTALTVTNATHQKREFHYKDDGGTRHHVFFNGYETKTFHGITSLTQVILNSHDTRLRDVNSRLGKSFTPSWTLTSVG